MLEKLCRHVLNSEPIPNIFDKDNDELIEQILELHPAPFRLDVKEIELILNEQRSELYDEWLQKSIQRYENTVRLICKVHKLDYDLNKLDIWVDGANMLQASIDDLVLPTLYSEELTKNSGRKKIFQTLLKGINHA